MHVVKIEICSIVFRWSIRPSRRWFHHHAFILRTPTTERIKLQGEAEFSNPLHVSSVTEEYVINVKDIHQTVEPKRNMSP
jgi:hypothetical protein